MNRFFKSFSVIVLTLIGGVLSGFGSVFAANLPYTDVKDTDSYYNDLKRLYEKGIVSDNAEHLFYPDALMRRDEFVSIVVGVGCIKCLSPSVEDILRYQTNPFIDFDSKNINFYCVSYAKEHDIVKGYVIKSGDSYTCQNGKTYSETPFCSENTITRIEAVAVLLRQAKLWDDTLNATSFDRTEVISDVDTYWYGYALKGIQAGILPKNQDTTVHPNDPISKKEFVSMAARIFSANSCTLKTNINSRLSGTIRIFDDNIKEDPNAPVSTFSDRNRSTYDLFAYTESTGSFIYSWELIRKEDGKTLTGSGPWLNNIDLGKECGSWLVAVTITDTLTGESVVATSSIPTLGTCAPTALWVMIDSTILAGTAPSSTELSSKVSGWKWPFTYSWDLGDGNQSSLTQMPHTYQNSGIYPVTLTVRDSEGRIGSASLQIVLTENADKDKDGILNTNDRCPLVKWPASNNGCPLLDVYTGNLNGSGGLANPNIGRILTVGGVGGTCNYGYSKDRGAIFGSSACTSCPCLVTVDFNALLRSCDTIFGTILSPDKKTVYSQGNLFEIP